MEFTITITGTAPLLMHNSRLANPLDPAAKALKRVTGKRNKTDDDHEEVARLEHAGSLYIDPDAGPYIPADNIWRALYDAAKKTKRGPKVKEGLFIATDVNPLAYRGPRDVDGLWKDENFRHLASAKGDHAAGDAVPPHLPGVGDRRPGRAGSERDRPRRVGPDRRDSRRTDRAR